MRVVDGSVLGLIRQWLKAPVVEAPRGAKPPTVQRNDRGTPQGGVLSPLLANIYLHRSEEHTSELQSLAYLVCRLLLEKKKHSAPELDRISPAPPRTARGLPRPAYPAAPSGAPSPRPRYADSSTALQPRPATPPP